MQVIHLFFLRLLREAVTDGQHDIAAQRVGPDLGAPLPGEFVGTVQTIGEVPDFSS